MKNPFLMGFMALCLSYVFFTWLFPKLVINWSDSVEPRLFWISEGQANFGDYVVFEMKSPLIRDGKPFDAIKQVSCLPGNQVTRQGLSFFCDGRFLGRAKKTSKSGEPLSLYEAEGVIEEGSVFVSGSHPDSYDSRYLGPIEVSNIKHKATELF